MAAYLVGGRGSSRQAIGLGLAVAVSHTLGVLALAVITLAASSVLPPERLYPILGVALGRRSSSSSARHCCGHAAALPEPMRADRAHAHAHSARVTTTTTATRTTTATARIHASP